MPWSRYTVDVIFHFEGFPTYDDADRFMTLEGTKTEIGAKLVSMARRGLYELPAQAAQPAGRPAAAAARRDKVYLVVPQDKKQDPRTYVVEKLLYVVPAGHTNADTELIALLKYAGYDSPELTAITFEVCTLSLSLSLSLSFSL